MMKEKVYKNWRKTGKPFVVNVVHSVNDIEWQGCYYVEDLKSLVSAEYMTLYSRNVLDGLGYKLHQCKNCKPNLSQSSVYCYEFEE